MRLIDADELKEHLFVGADYDKAIDDGIAKTEEEVFAFHCGWNDALASVMDYAPTVDAVPLEDYKSMERTVDKLTKALADAEPRRHGHWDNKIIGARFDVPHTVARCSNCKGKIWVYEENYVVKYPYCPLCGCKMDEVTE